MARSPLPTHVAPADRRQPPPADEQFQEPGRRDFTPAGPSRWRPWVCLVLSIAAFGVSFYLTLTHFDAKAVPLACSGSGLVNCQAVTTSSQSMVFGIFPVALLGLIFYTAMVVLNVPALWRVRWWFVAPLRLVAAITGIGFVLYLIFAELQIGAICVWCTSVHALTFILFMLVVTGWEDATAYADAVPRRRH